MEFDTATQCFVIMLFLFSAEEEINLLVIVVDVNPIWWGQQAQREPEVLLLILSYFVDCAVFAEKNSIT